MRVGFNFIIVKRSIFDFIYNIYKFNNRNIDYILWIKILFYIVKKLLGKNLEFWFIVYLLINFN